MDETPAQEPTSILVNPDEIKETLPEIAPSDPVLLGVVTPRPLIRARATITTGGMLAGDVVQADPDSPFVQLCLEHGWLVPV